MIPLLKDIISVSLFPLTSVWNKGKGITLVYHSISELPRGKDAYRINIAPRQFEGHLKYLSSLKKKDLLLTFDDGFDNFFYNALPVILRYNIKIILFISVGFIEGKITPDLFFRSGSCAKPLTWRQVMEVADAGVEIGSHSLSHANLREVDSRKAYREIHDSKIRIEDMIGKEVKYFAYPYGSRNAYNERLKEMVKECGYEKAYTNIMGFNKIDSDPYELRRIRIYNNDNMFRFKIKMKGGYNWVDHLNYPRFKNVK